MPTLHELTQAGLVTFVVLFGAAVGSFLNVVIYRLPKGRSLIFPRSRCPHCDHAIPAWANLPVLSYLLLHGRCHHCQGSISPRYPLVEALTAGIFLGLFLRWGLDGRLLVYWPLGAGLIAITFIDLDHQIIPNAITLPGIVVGLACAVGLSFTPDLVDAALGAALVGGMMWGIAAFYEWRTGRIGLGLGDVKMMAMLGTFLGLEATLGVLILGSLLGLVQGLTLMALQRAGRLTRIPFGPALALAGIAHLFEPGMLMGLLAPS